ncbi:hypothetical protein ID866_6713 [Astraeus odoratus]|nr:hypothetical protein ID866_6713 [Astraeus odoratus]
MAPRPSATALLVRQTWKQFCLISRPPSCASPTSTGSRSLRPSLDGRFAGETESRNTSR